VITAATVVAGLAAPSKMNTNNNTAETNKPEQTTTATPAQPKQTQNTNANNTKQQQTPAAASQPVKPQPESVKPVAEPSQPTAPKVFSYKDAVAKPAVAQAVPTTAIPTARQTPPAQQPSTQTSLTITNSKAEPAAATASKPVQQQSSNNNNGSDVGKSKKLPVPTVPTYPPKNIQWIMGNRERTQSASVSTESYEKKLFEIVQCKSENEVIFENIEVSQLILNSSETELNN